MCSLWKFVQESSIPFWGARMNNAMKSFWRVCYFKTQEEEWFTVIPKSTFAQQLTVERWDPGNVDFKFREFVVQKICMNLQLDG